ncbi:hypothetical protein IBE10_09145 [Francisella tularensis subsp. novicida]|uniref:hypothetical protein n=1 Tax=Francisella tularensis TaxID=263 RepID=UPI00090C5B85|nr:hypothetical protein [Francisella tularensis]APC96174.1 hypothetical protein KX02_1855 [Francisella tularensis subsp. novicida]MBK2347080.1 hypothetical protein [Francisella tularensis subsp. novicida]
MNIKKLISIMVLGTTLVSGAFANGISDAEKQINNINNSDNKDYVCILTFKGTLERHLNTYGFEYDYLNNEKIIHFSDKKVCEEIIGDLFVPLADKGDMFFKTNESNYITNNNLLNEKATYTLEAVTKSTKEVIFAFSHNEKFLGKVAFRLNSYEN